jgi:hypothetical protein
LDHEKDPTKNSISAQTHYFETIDLFTVLKVGSESFKFSKVLRNDELDYFTLPFERGTLSYAQELAKYMSSYMQKLVQFVRRIQKNVSYKPTFKRKVEYEETKKDKKVNALNRKISIVFAGFSDEALLAILEPIKQVLGDETEDVSQMLDILTTSSPKRVNLLTANLDGS